MLHVVEPVNHPKTEYPTYFGERYYTRLRELPNLTALGYSTCTIGNVRYNLIPFTGQSVQGYPTITYSTGETDLLIEFQTIWYANCLGNLKESSNSIVTAYIKAILSK